MTTRKVLRKYERQQPQQQPDWVEEEQVLLAKSVANEIYLLKFNRTMAKVDLADVFFSFDHHSKGGRSSSLGETHDNNNL